jgi:two-component system chemotaxis response regulator CheB
MQKIRVLVIDDSVVIRRWLSENLGSHPEIEVVGTASDGKIGLAKIPQVNPDIIILDLEMPVMDGLQTLAAIRKTYKDLPVIIFSSVSKRGACATLDALTLGASDYATKASNFGADRTLCDELIPKIKALCLTRIPSLPLKAISATPIPGRASPRHHLPAPVDIVAIGVSTGGPNALSSLLPSLAANFPVPVVIVQHMPPMFTQQLAERLAHISGHPVREGKHGEMLHPGDMWIAPGGLHMEVESTAAGVRLCTHDGPPENSCRPAVDVLFRSVAKVYGPRVLAIVLTGMGHDGLRGCQNIHEAGGKILAQDEASSVVWGMPGAVSRAGLADKVLPLSALATEINRLTFLPRDESARRGRETSLAHHR